jgi:hypothetical protein
MRVLISRTLPAEVVIAAKARFDVSVREKKYPMNVVETRAALLHYDAIIPTLGDSFSSQRLRANLNFSASFWPILGWAITT